MSDTNNADKIIVGASGTIYVAPVGTAFPVSADDTLAVGWEAVGFVAEDGVTVTPTQTVTPIKAWQSPYPVRKIVTERTLELDFKMREFNDETLPFAFGGGQIVISGTDAQYTPPGPEESDPRALIVEWHDGSKHFRLHVPNGQVTNLAAFTLSRTAPAELPVKYDVNYAGTDPYPWTILSSDSMILAS